MRAVIGNAETLVTSSYDVTGSYDSADFLNFSASINIDPQTYYSLNLYQLNPNNQVCKELYRGEIYLFDNKQSYVTQSAQPFTSHTSTNSFIRWNN